MRRGEIKFEYYQKQMTWTEFQNKFSFFETM